MAVPLLAGAVVVCAGVAAVGADSAATQPSMEELATHDGPLELVSEADKRLELYPLKESSGAYWVKSGRKPEGEVAYRLEMGDDGQWSMTLNDMHMTYLRRRKDGATMVPREDDLGEHIEIDYEPVMQLVPGTWENGPVVEGTATMTVKNIRTGLVREKGTCVYRIELVGKQKVHTPAGDFEALVVRQTRHIRLSLAKSDVVMTSWYAPGRGAVAEHIETTTKAFGFIGGKKVTDSRLAR